MAYGIVQGWLAYTLTTGLYGRRWLALSGQGRDGDHPAELALARHPPFPPSALATLAISKHLIHTHARPHSLTQLEQVPHIVV